MSFSCGKQIADIASVEAISLVRHKQTEMKDENKFLSRSREREKWKKKLAGQNKREAKAAAIYFRPNLSDDKRIRDLAELTGETKNAIVEKLVACALHNRSFTTQKLDEQKNALRRLEDKTEAVAEGYVEVLTLLDEIRRNGAAQERLISSLLAEIYCMVHTAVSLLRTMLLRILGLTNKGSTVTPPTPQILASFDETSDLTIARSLQDLESAADHHQIKNGKLKRENLFWKSKLRKINSEIKAEEPGI